MEGVVSWDSRVRTAAFEWLARHSARYGEVFDRATLQAGFEFQGHRIHLVSPQGIFTPAGLALPLTITTVCEGPYEDSVTSDGLLAYKYRGQDPFHRDNVGLRSLMLRRIPLIYFYGISKGKYLAGWPVYVVGDLPQARTFSIAVEDASLSSDLELDRDPDVVSDVAETGRRIYVTSVFRRRLHQQSFRERVLKAYREQCALCRLRHASLLDAAHIVPDSEPGGGPVISNGLALCKLHHAAFDRYFLGIRPDFRVEVRPDILDEEDGPMLRFGLQGLHQQKILLPSAVEDRPNPRYLNWRYQLFRSTQ